MLWILSSLRALRGFSKARTWRAVFPLFLFLAAALSGAACRDDSEDARDENNDAFDDADASPVAGTIQGSFAVSSTGEATYTMPLVVPPGAAGMQPSLAITYNSASGDGMLGMGFSLSGLSAITRCPLTMAQDGQVRSVRYDQLDALCLDGARLVPVGSSDGVVEYRTFPDSFSKVLAFPSKVPGNPADTLKVFSRSGLILEYGGAPDAWVMGRNGLIRSWLIKRMSDRSENTIDYEYMNFTANDAHTTEYVPFRIRYTGNRSVLPSRTVQFTYEPKVASERRALFAGGMELKSAQRLKTISMLGPENALVREYRFAYKAGVGTGRTLLRNIRECAADDTCKPRTTFAWTGEKPGFERTATPIEVPESQLAAPMMLDVTGDGLDDLVVPTVPWNAATHSERPSTDWTVTPNLGAAKGAAAGFFQTPVVAYSEDHNDQLNLFLGKLTTLSSGALADANEKLDEAAKKNGGRPETPKPPKQPPVRRPLPPGLRRVDNPLTVPTSERPCPTCGKERTCIAHETTEVIDLIPGEVIVRLDIKEIIGCDDCDAELQRAPMGDKVVSGGAYGSTLVADLLMGKYKMGLPRHRQAEALEHLGLSIPSSSMADQILWATDLLRPLWRHLLA